MLKDIEKKDRPRERLIRKGPNSLTDTELLAIILGTGSKKKDVLNLSEEILKEYTITELKDLTYEQIIEFDGIHMAKACQLLACFELAKRAVSKEDNLCSLQTPKQIYQWVYADFYLETQEILIVIYVNCKLRPIKKSIFRGDSSYAVQIPVKALVSNAISCHAYGVILLHNHPSGSLQPSKADILATLEIQSILMKLDIFVLDHLVVSPKNYYSFEQNGIFQKSFSYDNIGDIDEKMDIEMDYYGCSGS